MSTPLYLHLADTRAVELRREAAAARLAALARCCRPAAWRRATTAVVHRLAPRRCCTA